MSWTRYIRFCDEDGIARQGEPQIDLEDDLTTLVDEGTLFAYELIGQNPFEAKRSGKRYRVQQLLGPLALEDVPIIRCVGLNYATHIQELGRAPPPYPSIFIKPSHTVTSWNSAIPIPRIAQKDQVDFEGELAIVIGKAGKDIPASDALNFVAGYTVCNDVSARAWQRDPLYAGSVPQWCFGKGFDGFAPLGPMIVSTEILGAADSLSLQTKVNGIVRQQANTNDLVFGVRDIVAFVLREA
ncbi:hypothetical protein ZTR_04944 [Talaromyces verruculosus]|nr:hypothetical protein ZTR_04944 [Talaromyces verruculosus]